MIVVVVSKAASELKSAIYLNELVDGIDPNSLKVVVVQNSSNLKSLKNFWVNREKYKEKVLATIDAIYSIIAYNILVFPYALRIKIPLSFRNFYRLNTVLKRCSDENVYFVNDLNGKELEFILDGFDNCILVLAGTGIIRSNIIEKANVVYNVHGSILPGYRGVKSEFWAVFHSNPGTLGHSLHQVDKGIDTGKVLYKEPLRFTSNAQHHGFLRLLNLKQGANTLIRFLWSKYPDYKLVKMDNSDKGYYTAPSLKQKWNHYRKR